jgi:hypothetical protein
VVFVRTVLRAVGAAHGCLSGIASSRILQFIGTNTHRAHRRADGSVKHSGGEYRRDNGDEGCACSADPNHWVAELYTLCARRPFTGRITAQGGSKRIGAAFASGGSFMIYNQQASSGRSAAW